MSSTAALATALLPACRFQRYSAENAEDFDLFQLSTPKNFKKLQEKNIAKPKEKCSSPKLMLKAWREFCLAPWLASGGREVETWVHENAYVSWLTTFLSGKHGMVTFTEVHAATKEDLEEQTDMNSGCSWPYFPCMQVIKISFTCHQLNQKSFIFQDLKTFTSASYHPYPSHHFPVPGRQQPPGSTRTAVLLSFTENLTEFSLNLSHSFTLKAVSEMSNPPNLTIDVRQTWRIPARLHLDPPSSQPSRTVPWRAPLQQLEPKRRIHRNVDRLQHCLWHWNHQPPIREKTQKMSKNLVERH